MHFFYLSDSLNNKHVSFAQTWYSVVFNFLELLDQKFSGFASRPIFHFGPQMLAWYTQNNGSKREFHSNATILGFPKNLNILTKLSQLLEPFVQWKFSMNVKGSSLNYECQKRTIMFLFNIVVHELDPTSHVNQQEGTTADGILLKQKRKKQQQHEK